MVVSGAVVGTRILAGAGDPWGAATPQTTRMTLGAPAPQAPPRGVPPSKADGSGGGNPPTGGCGVREPLKVESRIVLGHIGDKVATPRLELGSNLVATQPERHDLKPAVNSDATP